MQTTILSFGSIAEITGKSFNISDVSDVKSLKIKLFEIYPALKNKSFLISVDKKIVTNETILLHSTVALLPPFSGG